MTNLRPLLNKQNKHYFNVLCDYYKDYEYDVFPQIPLRNIISSALYKSYQEQFRNTPQQYWLDMYQFNFLLCDAQSNPMTVIDSDIDLNYNSEQKQFRDLIIQSMGIEYKRIEFFFSFGDVFIYDPDSGD